MPLFPVVNRTTGSETTLAPSVAAVASALSGKLSSTGNGSGLTGLTQSQISGLVDALAAKLASNGNGSGLTGLTVSQLSDASANGKSLISAADYAAMRLLLGLVIGTNVLAPDGNGSALTGLTQSQISGLVDALAAKLASNGNGSGLTGLTVSQLSDASANGKSLISAANYAAMRVLLGLVIGTDVLSPTGNGSGLTGLTQSQISGLGTIATQAANSVSITGGTITGVTISGVPLCVKSTLTSDLVQSHVAGTFQDIFSVTLTTGRWRIYVHVDSLRNASQSVILRFITGTAALAGALNDAVGLGIMEASTTHLRIAATGTWTSTNAARFSGDNNTCHILLATVNVTTAGTFKVQGNLNTTGNMTWQAGSFILCEQDA